MVSKSKIVSFVFVVSLLVFVAFKIPGWIFDREPIRNEPVPGHVLAGVYKGNYDDFSQTIKIKGDGSFSQNIIGPTKKILKNQGKWILHAEGVTFSPFITSEPTLSGGRVLSKIEDFRANWFPSEDKIMLDEDLGYFVVK